jgi:glycosyltransferase involved in cell wall biosynthesis
MALGAIFDRRNETMRHVALFAPGALPPWTEGRKIFVSQLADKLQSRGVEVSVLNGSGGRSTAAVIFRALRDLRRTCRAAVRPDAVAVFPYGTFRGSRGMLNVGMLRLARAVCANACVPQIPVFYSCAGLTLEQLGERFGPALAIGRSGANVTSIHLGIRHGSRRWRARDEGLKSALFLCGYQRPTAEALRAVLFERGLADLLDAGNALARRDIHLTIAIPFLRDARMRDRLRAQAARRCSELKLELLDEVDAETLFMSHDVFVFPYHSEHAVFVPTSLLEAMSVGIPVVAADQLMYRDITVGHDGPRCALCRIGDSADLARALGAMQQDYQAAIGRAEVAAAYVRSEWTIERSADEITGVLDDLLDKRRDR